MWWLCAPARWFRGALLAVAVLSVSVAAASEPRTTFATVIASPRHLPGALALAESLARVGSKHPLRVFAVTPPTTQLGEDHPEHLGEAHLGMLRLIPGVQVIAVDGASVPPSSRMPPAVSRRIDEAAATLRLWNQTEFARVGFLRHNVLALANIDGLLDVGATDDGDRWSLHPPPAASLASLLGRDDEQEAAAGPAAAAMSAEQRAAESSLVLAAAAGRDRETLDASVLVLRPSRDACGYLLGLLKTLRWDGRAAKPALQQIANRHLAASWRSRRRLQLREGFNTDAARLRPLHPSHPSSLPPPSIEAAVTTVTEEQDASSGDGGGSSGEGDGGVVGRLPRRSKREGASPEAVMALRFAATSPPWLPGAALPRAAARQSPAPSQDNPLATGPCPCPSPHTPSRPALTRLAALATSRPAWLCRDTGGPSSLAPSPAPKRTRRGRQRPVGSRRPRSARRAQLRSALRRRRGWRGSRRRLRWPEYSMPCCPTSTQTLLRRNGPCNLPSPVSARVNPYLSTALGPMQQRRTICWLKQC